MAETSPINTLRDAIRDIPDFPKPGIVFKDITPLLGNAKLFKIAIKEMADRVRDLGIEHVVAIESRGFIFGSPLAVELGAGLVIVRKPNKLPFDKAHLDYSLEYGTDRLEMHVDSFKKGDRVLIVDDLLATGGTALATAQLTEKLGARVEGLVFLTELDALKGRDKLSKYRLFSLINF